jgi:hypothetical protein
MFHERASSVREDHTTCVPRRCPTTLPLRRCRGYDRSISYTDEQAYPHLCGGRMEEVTSHGATALLHGTLLYMDVFTHLFNR